MSKFVFLSGTLILAASPVLAQTTDKDTTRNPDERVICQKEEKIGSRLAPKKICLTAKEWKERAALNREETERVQQGTGVRPAG